MKLFNFFRYSIRRNKLSINTSILVVLAFNIIYCIPCFFYNYLIDGDEFSGIAFAEFLAGRNWSDIVSNISSWHGYGHIICLSPLLRLCSSWFSSYLIIKLYMLILWCIFGIIILLFTKKYMHTRWIESIIISLCATISLLRPDYGVGLSALTEFACGFVMVITGFLLFFIVDKTLSYKKEIIASMILGFLMTYSLTIHSRMIVYIVVCYTLYLICAFCFKDIRKFFLISFVTSIIGTTIYKLIDNIYIVNVLTNKHNTTREIYNTLSHQSKSGLLKIASIWDVESIRNVFDICLSQYASFVLISFGLITIFFLICVKVLYIIIKNRLKEKIGLAICISVSICSFIVMLFAIAIREEHNLITDSRWYIYIRYTYPFVVNILIYGGVLACKRYIDVKKVIIQSFFINIIFFIYFMKYTFIKISSMRVMGSIANVFRRYFFKEESDYFVRYSVFFISISLVFLYITYRKKQVFLIILSFFLFVSIIFWGSSLNYNFERKKEMYAFTDKSCQIVDYFECDNSKIEIYYSGDVSFTRNLRYICINSDLKYISQENLEAINLDNGFLLTNINDLDVGVYSFSLDSNEFLYTSNEDIYSIIIKRCLPDKDL